MFKISNLTAIRNNKILFNNLNLEINQGDKIALIGDNGVGKSTLLKILDGVCFDYTGEVYFYETLLCKKTLQSEEFRQKFRLNVALMFQNTDAMLFNPTVYDEIAFTSRMFKIPNINNKVLQIALLLQISDLLDKTPFLLSGGQKQKVALACVLAHSPQVLLLDEPSASLDTTSKELLIATLKNLTSNTLIIATHDLDLSNSLCNRTINLF